MLPDFLRKRPHVETRRADQMQTKARAIPLQDVQQASRHVGRLKRHRLVPSRQVVGAIAVDFLGGEGRRLLLIGAPKPGDRFVDVQARQPGHRTRIRMRDPRAGSIEGGGAFAKRHFCDVFLFVGGKKLRQAGRLAEDEREDARRERIERTRVPNFLYARDAPRHGDDVVRRGSRRLVDDKDAVRKNARQHYLVRMGPHPHALPSLTLRILK